MGKKTFWQETTFEKKVGRDEAGRAIYEKVLARVEVEVDFDMIFRAMGHAALHNKSRKSREGGGMLVVSVSKERPL